MKLPLVYPQIRSCFVNILLIILLISFSWQYSSQILLTCSDLFWLLSWFLHSCYLGFFLSHHPVILGISFASFLRWIPCCLISFLLGPYFGGKHSPAASWVLGGFFWLRKLMLSSGNFIELVFWFPSLDISLSLSHRIPIFFDVAGIWTGLLIIFSSIFHIFLFGFPLLGDFLSFIF